MDINPDFLTSTPHQIIWGSNSTVANKWDPEVCVVAEALLCLRATEGGASRPKMTVSITQNIHEILGWLRESGREPTDETQWMEFTKRGKLKKDFWVVGKAARRIMV